jgi:Fe-S oxidoreductase
VLYNVLFSNRLIAGSLKYLLGFTQKRKLPLLSPVSFASWLKQHGYLQRRNDSVQPGKPEICFFIDEFTNYLDSEKGITAAKLLTKLGYSMQFYPGVESGRTYISKGLLRKARKIVDRNIIRFREVLNNDRLLIGIEPSAVLTFRDEYPDLASKELREDARSVSKFCLTIEEFIAAEYLAGRIDRKLFTTEKLHINLHGHCQQKSIASTSAAITMLSIPENYSVEEIKSGCCGMAGAFGFEKRHYDLSMKIGELVLFPAVRSSEPGTVICAAGTSCRQQIMDGTGVQALHPVEILYHALKSEV